MKEQIGVIESVRFGLTGYQECQLGFEFRLSGEGWGTTHIKVCGWGHVSEEDLKKFESNHKWTHESRIKHLGEICWQVFMFMQDAKVNSLEGLVGKPVAVFF